MSVLMLSWVFVPLSCSFLVSIRGDRSYLSLVLKGIEVLLLRKCSCWVSLCGSMCVMLEALNFKGLGGQCSNDRKQILLHSRNHGVSRKIVLKVVSATSFPLPTRMQEGDSGGQKGKHHLLCPHSFLKLWWGCIKNPCSVSGQGEENPQESLFLLLPILMINIRPD